jgi:hypothetical protein
MRGRIQTFFRMMNLGRLVLSVEQGTTHTHQRQALVERYLNGCQLILGN